MKIRGRGVGVRLLAPNARCPYLTEAFLDSINNFCLAVWRFLQPAAESVLIEKEGLDVGKRAHGGYAPVAGQQPNFAKVVATVKVGHKPFGAVWLYVYDFGVPMDDDVELIGNVTLPDDDIAGGKLHGAGIRLGGG